MRRIIGIAAVSIMPITGLTAGASPHTASTCTINIPITYGNGYAQAEIKQSCTHPAWVWARFPNAPSFTEYGPHKTAPPNAPKYSVVGSGSSDGWGVPYCGGRGLWYNGSAHYRTIFGSCTPP